MSLSCISIRRVSAHWRMPSFRRVSTHWRMPSTRGVSTHWRMPFTRGVSSHWRMLSIKLLSQVTTTKISHFCNGKIIFLIELDPVVDSTYWSNSHQLNHQRMNNGANLTNTSNYKRNITANIYTAFLWVPKGAIETTSLIQWTDIEYQFFELLPRRASNIIEPTEVVDSLASCSVKNCYSTYIC